MAAATQFSSPPLFEAPQPPLHAPYYGAGLMTAVARFWKKYATFSGRASRSEYWMAMLANAIVGVTLSVLLFVTMYAGSSVGATGRTIPSPFFGIILILIFVLNLAAMIPTFAITWRRLHDTGRSGGVFFISFIPFVGDRILFGLLALPSDPSGARFDRAR